MSLKTLISEINSLISLLTVIEKKKTSGKMKSDSTRKFELR